MNTIAVNKRIIKELNSTAGPVGWKDLDSDTYHNLSFNWANGMYIYETWVYAPILNKDVRVTYSSPANEFNASVLRKFRNDAVHLLVSKLAIEYCRHPKFGKVCK